MKAQDQRGRYTCIKCRVDIIAQRTKDNWKNNIFNDFPSNENDYKGQTVFFQKGLQLIFGEVVEFIRYSSFEPIDHKFFGGGARSRTVVLRIPLQVLIPVETQTTPHLKLDSLR